MSVLFFIALIPMTADEKGIDIGIQHNAMDRITYYSRRKLD